MLTHHGAARGCGSNAWQVDTSRLLAEGLPIIRYLPGAPPVGKHGDMNEHDIVPNATLVAYLTDAEVAGSGHTIFPDADVSVAPKKGSVLAFQNVDAAGAPHPRAQHLVGAVAKEATGDRLVMQIPIMHPAGEAPYAYPQHVSGMKKPGQHESMRALPPGLRPLLFFSVAPAAAPRPQIRWR